MLLLGGFGGNNFTKCDSYQFYQLRKPIKVFIVAKNKSFKQLNIKIIPRCDL